MDIALPVEGEQLAPVVESFASLGLDAWILKALGALNIERPTAIQSLSIVPALTGSDVCGKAATGSGKTLAFGIPMLQRLRKAQPKRPEALVLVPTRELAVQVSRVFVNMLQYRHDGKRWAEAVYGGVPIDRQIRSLQRGVDLVVATPGRLVDLADRRAIDLSAVSTLVIDEADLMADMGFMPAVEDILGRLGQNRQTMLFSATLDGDVDRLVSKFMRSPVFVEMPDIDDASSRMTHHFLAADTRDKPEFVEVMTRGADRAIVFARTRDGADRLGDMLSERGVDVGVLTGGVRQGARERILRSFSQGRLNVLVATDVAARGIDINGLPLVIHYDLPDDAKTFVHRSGRTARAGKGGVVVTLVPRAHARRADRLKRDLGIDIPTMVVDLEDPGLPGISSGEEMSGTRLPDGPRERPRSEGRRYSNGGGSSSSYGRPRRNGEFAGRSSDGRGPRSAGGGGVPSRRRYS